MFEITLCCPLIIPRLVHQCCVCCAAPLMIPRLAHQFTISESSLKPSKVAVPNTKPNKTLFLSHHNNGKCISILILGSVSKLGFPSFPSLSLHCVWRIFSCDERQLQLQYPRFSGFFVHLLSAFVATKAFHLVAALVGPYNVLEAFRCLAQALLCPHAITLSCLLVEWATSKASNQELFGSATLWTAIGHD